MKMEKPIRWTMKELEEMRDKEYKETFGIASFTNSLSILEVVDIHAYLMEWAEAIHLGNEMESEYYRGKIGGILIGLGMAHQLKDEYKGGVLLNYFEKFVHDWASDGEYWNEEGE